MLRQTPEDIRQAVRESYRQAAGAGCCGPGCCSGAAPELSRQMGYSEEDVQAAPAGANLGFGCGNPQALAALQDGERVLDLGCGAGFDCFLAARQVGPSGLVIGVDMTPEMLVKARHNARELGLATVEFRLGEIENLPVADNFVDVILSNCVINLSPDKARVFREACRVLKPGGRLAIADIIATREIPSHLREDLALHAGCVAGAVTAAQIESLLLAAGFAAVQIRRKESSRDFIASWSQDAAIRELILAATIEARKPVI